MEMWRVRPQAVHNCRAQRLRLYLDVPLGSITDHVWPKHCIAVVPYGVLVMVFCFRANVSCGESKRTEWCCLARRRLVATDGKEQDFLARQQQHSGLQTRRQRLGESQLKVCWITKWWSHKSDLRFRVRFSAHNSWAKLGCGRRQVPSAARIFAAQPRCRERGVLGCKGVKSTPMARIQGWPKKWMAKLKQKSYFFFPWLWPGFWYGKTIDVCRVKIPAFFIWPQLACI